MPRRHRHILPAIVAAMAIALTGCTDNGRLQQAIANANISLVGQDNGMGGHCDGFSLSGDTVVLTYNYWPHIAGDDLLGDPATAELNRPASLRGMRAKLREYDGVASAMLRSGSGFIYRRAFADGRIDVFFSADEVKDAVNDKDNP